MENSAIKRRLINTYSGLRMTTAEYYIGTVLASCCKKPSMTLGGGMFYSIGNDENYS